MGFIGNIFNNIPTPPTPPTPGGLLGGGFIGGNLPTPPNPPTPVGGILGGGFISGGLPNIPKPPRPTIPRPGGFIGGVFGGPIGGPIPSRGNVPYHTHSIETTGPNRNRSKVVTGNRPIPIPPVFGNRPGILPGTTHTSIPRPVTTIKPGMNIPAVPMAPMMRNASGCGAGYSNASGDDCGLWMCNQDY